MPAMPRIRSAIWLLALALLSPACSGTGHSHGAVIEWVAGHDQPAFDPDGPPDALRWALERQLSHGLTEEDSSGRIVPAAAESIGVSRDGLTLRFRLRPDVTFTDGRRCTSHDFRAALESGLARSDHGTRAVLLAAVRGVDGVRAGRPLPRLGIETPDAHTLVLQLSRPDSLLLRKLALPGVSSPWRQRAGVDWNGAVGIGPYRVSAMGRDRRLTLVRSLPHGRVDTLRVRFIPATARLRSLMRAQGFDLLWPLAPGLLDEPLPATYRTEVSRARPERHLLLVMRSDVPPTTTLPARRALAHALNRGEMQTALGALGQPPGALIEGAPAFEQPTYDLGEVGAWLERGHLGRSFHAVLAFDAGGAPAIAARALQGGWSRVNLYAELRGLRGAAFQTEALHGSAQLLLVESQPLIDRPEWRLADLVMPMRGPAVGAFRTGWRTREFDVWLVGRPGAQAFSPGAAQSRIEDETQILPLSRLPWVRVVRSSGPETGFHPHFGPDFTTSAPTVEGPAALAPG
jgi:ABC-type transport system substrate-binding protein